ncbi:MAG: KEOPS complex subunit Cgi121 [Candidatus Micrarchaeota archaeon]|nr:KEOPS complex subunit Cgi121 [Candidatus Micrarchaeota archaeon]
MIAQYCVAKKNSKIQQIILDAKKNGLELTAIDSEKIKDFREIELAAYLTHISFYKNPIANKIENEFLLHLSGKRQIKDAIEEYGAKEDKDFIIVYFGEKDLEEIIKDYKIETYKELNRKLEDQELFKILENKSVELLKD